MSITVNSAAHRFHDGRGVRNISFTVGAGEIVCLLGPNGSGKSTILRLIAGLLKGTGQVRIDDYSTNGLPPAQQLGSVVGDLLNTTWTVRQYLRLVATARTASRPDIEEVIERYSLHQFARRRIRSLSLGQARRVHFAGAILGRPRNLILDEPLNGVDAHARATMIEDIRAVAASGGSVLITSHQLEHLERLIDRIVIVREGTIVSDTSTMTLIERSGLTHIIVECSDPYALATELRGLRIGDITHRPPHGLTIRNASRDVVGEAAFRRSLIVTRLEQMTPSLETVYLALTTERFPLP